MKTTRFLVIDDDPDNNMITKFALNKTPDKAEIKIFLIPEEALEYIEKEYSQKEHLIPTVILLDINMPTMSGWEFIEAFSKFPEKLKEHFIIYILSTSVDERDKERADSNPIVSEYLEKPITKETALRICSFNKVKINL